MASSTLIEVQRQGHALDKVERGLDTVSRAIAFPRLVYLFQILIMA
jgi:hypothetical protein